MPCTSEWTGRHLTEGSPVLCVGGSCAPWDGVGEPLPTAAEVRWAYASATDMAAGPGGAASDDE